MVRFYPLTKTGSKSESSIPRRTQTAIARKKDFRDSVRINAIFRREKLFPTKYGKASGSENTTETNQTTTNGKDSTKKTITITTATTKKKIVSSRSDPTTTGASSDVDADAIRRANFAGKIPVRLTLARSSLSSATPPHPQHVLVSRHTFLHVGLESAVRELHKYAPQALHLQMHGVHHHGKIVVREEGDSDNDNDNEKQKQKQNEKDKGDDNETNSSSSSSSSSDSSSSCKANDAAESSSKGPLSAEPESAITPYPVCWFEDVATQQPLRWQYFAGVLFDSLPPTTRTTNSSSSSTTNASRRQLPWELRLHFRSYPSDTLLELLDPNHGHGTGVLETIQQIYKNSLKQGLVIHHGNAREALNLSKQSHTVLWEEGIRGGSYDAIRPILFPEKKRSNGGADRDKGKNKGGDNNEHAAKQSSQTAAPGSEKVSDSASSEPNAERKEPKDASKRDNHDSSSSSKDVRDSKDETTVPTEGTNPKTNPAGCSRDNAPDKSVPASANNGNHTGKNDPRSPATIPVRLSLDPTKPMLQKRIGGGGGGGGGGACGPSGEEPTLGSLLRGWASPQRNEDIRHHEVRVGGISPPLSTPLVDLWKILRHPDNFLYVCVVPNNTNRGNRNKTHNHKDQEQDHRNGKSSLLVGTPRWKTTIVSSRFSSARRRRRNRKK